MRLDVACVAALRALGEARFRALLELYLVHSTRLLERYRQARADSDLGAALASIHNLRSASASVGALALGRHCREIEAGLRTGRWPVVAVERLDADVAAACAAVRRELADPDAGFPPTDPLPKVTPRTR